jgi:hypothetical protein
MQAKSDFPTAQIRNFSEDYCASTDPPFSALACFFTLA